MGRVVLPIRRKSIDNKIELAKLMVKEMTGNPDFPNPSPALPDLLAAANELYARRQDVLLAKAALREALTQRNIADKKLTNMLRQEASYVELASDGNEAKITCTGLRARKAKGTSHKPPMPENVRLKAGEKSGEIFVRWKPLAEHYYITAYQIRYSFVIDGEPEWHIYPDTTRKSKISFISPKPGQMVLIGVRAVNAAGGGAWSATHYIMAPVIL